MMEDNNLVVELNVGGVYYTTALSTLTRESDSLLATLFAKDADKQLHRDSKGRYFIDRDGVLFRYVLDFLRNRKIVLPENFHERERLRVEAEFYRLPEMVRQVNAVMKAGAVGTAGSNLLLSKNASLADVTASLNNDISNTGSVGGLNNDYSSSSMWGGDDKYTGYITVGYRGTFASGREGMGDVKFRKLTRILVCGRVSLCRQVFGDTLNESRDPDRGLSSRYTSRFFLKHSSLEQAFESLQEAGFTLVAACASGTSGSSDAKPGAADSEENRWNHYNEFVFCRS